MTHVNKLQYLLMKHLSYIESIYIQTIKIERSTYLKNIDQIEYNTSNRDRLINISETIQVSIQKHVDTIPKPLIDKEITILLKEWASDVNLVLNKVDIVNNKIATILEQEKKNLSKEIGEIFNVKQAHNGYVLDNVRK